MRRRCGSSSPEVGGTTFTFSTSGYGLSARTKGDCRLDNGKGTRRVESLQRICVRLSRVQGTSLLEETNHHGRSQDDIGVARQDRAWIREAGVEARAAGSTGGCSVPSLIRGDRRERRTKPVGKPLQESSLPSKGRPGHRSPPRNRSDRNAERSKRQARHENRQRDGNGSAR